VELNVEAALSGFSKTKCGVKSTWKADYKGLTLRHLPELQQIRNTDIWYNMSAEELTANSADCTYEVKLRVLSWRLQPPHTLISNHKLLHSQSSHLTLGLLTGHLSPKGASPQTENSKQPHLWKVPERNRNSLTYLMWLRGHSWIRTVTWVNISWNQVTIMRSHYVRYCTL
jgi:hypothetical protein